MTSWARIVIPAYAAVQQMRCVVEGFDRCWEAGTRTPIRRSRVYSKRQKSRQIKELALQTAEESGRIRKTVAIRMTVQLRRPLCPERSRPDGRVINTSQEAVPYGCQYKFCREYQADLPRDTLRDAFSGTLGTCSHITSAPPATFRWGRVQDEFEFDSAFNQL